MQKIVQMGLLEPIAVPLEIVIKNVFPKAKFIYHDPSLLKTVNDCMTKRYGDKGVHDGDIIDPTGDFPWVIRYIDCPSKRYSKRIERFIECISKEYYLKYMYKKGDKSHE